VLCLAEYPTRFYGGLRNTSGLGFAANDYRCWYMASVEVPKGLAEAIRRRGFDLESFVLEAIERMLNLDPSEEIEARLEIAKHMLKRAREEIEKGDAIQASEKLYKAVEECIKILTCIEGLEECRRAREEGGWWTKLLSRAARKLALRLGEKIVLEAWSQGYDLHVHGFHEHSLGVDEVKESLPTVEQLIKFTEEKVKHYLEKERS